MNYVYHGSSVPDLKLIKKHKSTRMKEWVYACYSKAISIVFISKDGSDLFFSLSGNGKNYPVELVERKPGMFKKIFNCSGYIENIYDELIKLDKEGLIKLYLYPNRPDYVPIDNSDLIPKVLRWYKNGYDVNNFYNIYPELKDIFIEVSKKG